MQLHCHTSVVREARSVLSGTFHVNSMPFTCVQCVCVNVCVCECVRVRVRVRVRVCVCVRARKRARAFMCADGRSVALQSCAPDENGAHHPAVPAIAQQCPDQPPRTSAAVVVAPASLSRPRGPARTADVRCRWCASLWSWFGVFLAAGRCGWCSRGALAVSRWSIQASAVSLPYLAAAVHPRVVGRPWAVRGRPHWWLVCPLHVID